MLLTSLLPLPKVRASLIAGTSAIESATVKTEGIFIKVPQTLNAVLNDEAAIDLHSTVEEISAYLCFASCLRGYNIPDYLMLTINNQMGYNEFLHSFLNDVDSIHRSQHDIILKLLEEL